MSVTKETKEISTDQVNAQTIALIGNPNAGKTTIFNALTGSRQHVGNWPGVTVEKKEGRLLADSKVHVIDLPGTYSLGAYSEDELIARNYILFENPDVVLDIIDSANIRRNLYLTVQLLEMNTNIVLALNMLDEAEAKGIEIDENTLAKILNVPVIKTIGTKNQGIEKLISSSIQALGQSREPLTVDYGQEIEDEILVLQKAITEHGELAQRYYPRWLAVKILEGEDVILNDIQKYPNIQTIFTLREKAVQHLNQVFAEDIQTIIIEKRYGLIEGVVKQTVKQKKDVQASVSLSDKIDNVVLNKTLGIPIFLLTMWAIFKFTFVIGDPLIGYVEMLFEWFGGIVGAMISNELLASLIVDGIIGGLGSIFVFIPPIFTLFFAISLLEDSGYMSRVAYIVDKFMRSLGLHGKSFIPLLIGFGCNVPAIMATRTLENKKDRMVTILVNPFMSCAARLPVYVLFAGALFPDNAGTVIFSLYILGIVMAIIMAKIFKKFLFPGEAAPFVMELPPYRVPTLKGMLIHMWEKGSSFVRKAGTIIFAVVVLIWVLATLPWGVEYASQDSFIGMFGSAISPVFAPLGFGSWEASAALIFGLLAKEVIVGTLGVIYGVGEEGLAVTITQMWTPLAAYSFMVLTLLYVPCVATIGAIKRETNSWKWTGFTIGYTLALGWIVAFIVYQGGTLLGLG
ncbi:MAG: ferrous iron transporter B [Gracilibacter sp. BRH_c7a]|nr:MAG: ferrous iron transporter B [Gracilibacter sp. BRH_c7a]